MAQIVLPGDANALGTAFGSVVQFTTKNRPTVTTAAASSLTSTTAQLNGTGNPNGASAVGWFRLYTTDPAGVCSDATGFRVSPSTSFNLGTGTAGQANWVNVTDNNAVLPNRPVLGIALDPTVATADVPVGYAALGGFNANTPGMTGHVFQVTCASNCATFSWADKSGNLPDIPVADLIVAGHDLAISTHGRGFYILDNIEPLRQYRAPMTSGADPVLFKPADAIRASSPAPIQYLLKQPAQNVRIEILDDKGQIIRSYPDTANTGGRGGRGGAGADSAAGGGGRGRGGLGGGGAPSKTAGLSTFMWDQRYAPAVTFPGMILWGGTTNGPQAPPGKYTVRLTADGKTVTQPLVVKRNPMHSATDADLQAQFALAIQLRDKVSEANGAVIQIRDVKREVADRLGKSQDAQLKSAGDKLTNDLSAVEREIYQVKNQSGQDPLNFPIKVNNRIAALLGVVSNPDAKPIAGAYPIFNDLKSELKVQTDLLQKVLSTQLPLFNTEAKRVGLEPITVKKPVVF
jgi:hypothetical protein